MPRHLGGRAVRLLCRWRSIGPGVPLSGPVAFAIAVVVVGGSLLETGVAARTSIPSSDTIAPSTALIGPMDPPDRPIHAALVAQRAPGREVLPWILRRLQPVSPRSVTGLLAPALRVAALVPMPGPAAAALPAGLWLDAPPGAAAADAPATAVLAVTSPGAGGIGGIGGRLRIGRFNPWRTTAVVPWYGPGLYGSRTACGQRFTRQIVGVAHRTLPCGTLVQFRWGGRTAIAPVIDRGPFGVPGLLFDWSAGLACDVFKPRGRRNGCFTRTDVGYRVVGRVKLREWFHPKSLR